MFFDNTYAKLPDRFFARTEPAPAPAPRLLTFNEPLAEQLGLALAADDLSRAKLFSGALIPSGAEPIALAYAGHQFGHFVPQLGDGRALLLGEIVAPDGRRFDIQLKGSGRTPFSRGGDGRAAIGPVLREFLVSEAMHAMGVSTTRSLAAVATGDLVIREAPLPGSVLTRVAASHLRVGTFQYLAARRDVEGLRLLTEYAIGRHYRHLREAENSALALLGAVAQAQARLIAQWLGVGFIHGVMNTDNCSIAGETIDYGPCAFMDAYDPMTVFSSIDMQGRYAFANQPAIARWNLARLAEALLPLIDADTDAAIRKATDALEAFMPTFESERLAVMRAKLGLQQAREDDSALVEGLLQVMHTDELDFTLTFRQLSDRLREGGEKGDASPGFKGWLGGWLRRGEQETAPPEARAATMDAVNPLIIPRNHQVERALADAATGDLAAFEALLEAVRSPYASNAERENFVAPPQSEERVLQTFCGT